MDSGLDSSVVLVVEYPSGEYDRLMLQTDTSSDQPSSTLEFGPVKEAFAVAEEVLVGRPGSLLGVDGQAAVLPLNLRIHPDTIFLDPGYSAEVQDASLVRCAALAELNRVSPIVTRSIKAAMPGSVSDAERYEWLTTLSRELGRHTVGQFGLFEDLVASSRYDLLQLHPCSPLWSAKTNVENAQLRNDWALESCAGDRIEVMSRFGPQYREDLVVLLARPYDTLSVTERTGLRWMLERVGTEDNCRRYYPQLYGGAWVPLHGPE